MMVFDLAPAACYILFSSDDKGRAPDSSQAGIGECTLSSAVGRERALRVEGTESSGIPNANGFTQAYSKI